MAHRSTARACASGYERHNWEGADFKALFSGQAKTSAPVDKLIADQHFAVAICAPRAILIIENDIDWLGPVATYGGGVAGRTVYEARESRTGAVYRWRRITGIARSRPAIRRR